MEEFLEAKDLIQRGRNFLLCINPKRASSFDLNLSASCLFYTLKKMGKIVKLWPKEVEFKNPFFPFNPKDLKVIVFFSNNPNLLSEIYYKKGKNFIELNFLSKNTHFNLEKLPLEEVQNRVNAIITLGIYSLEILGEFYEKNFKIFFSLPILNIDNDLTNGEYGKINFIDKKPFSFLISKILFGISKEAIDEYSAKSLFCGILFSLKQKELDKETIKMLVSLKEKISEFSEISNYLLENFPPKEKKLFEIFLNFLEYNSKISLPIITIPKKELSSFSLKERDLPRGISLFRGKVWKISPILFLWESYASTQGVFYSPPPQNLKKLLDIFEGELDKERLFFVSKQSLLTTKSLILETFHG